MAPPDPTLVPAERTLARPPADLRRARPEDLDACARVWQVAIDDYTGRLNQPPMLTDVQRLVRLLRHLLDTDGDRFWVATRRPGPATDERGSGADGDRIVGFGSANVRGRAWFLAMLFVEPVEQAAGIGRALLARTFDGVPRPDGQPDDVAAGALAPGDASPDDGEPWTYATVTDAAQPVSNGLYARLGLVPRVPLLHLVGRVDRSDAFPALPRGVHMVSYGSSQPPRAPGSWGTVARISSDGEGGTALPAEIATIDRAVLGYEHPLDHRFRLDERVDGTLYLGTDGQPLGYGYVSRVGRVGPIAAIDRALLPAITGHLLASVEPNGAFSVWLPGSAGDTVTSVLRAGLRVEGFPGLLCWSRPRVDVTRYVPMSLALL